MMSPVSLISAATLSLAATASTLAGGTESWSFDLFTEGDDVFWVSPTNVAPNAAQYLGVYELQLIEVGIAWNGIPFGTVDVTDEVPREDRIGEELVDGPAPIVLLDGVFVAPEPPEPPAVQGTVKVELDADGFGNASITDVTLGTLEVDLGGFIGVQTVQITSIRIAGVIDVTPLGPNPDLNGDGVVNVSDLLILLSAWGDCPVGAPCPADLNGDGVVNVSDLLILLANWG